MVRELPEQAQQILRAAAVGGTRDQAWRAGCDDRARATPRWMPRCGQPWPLACWSQTRMVVTRSGTSCSARHCSRICFPGRVRAHRAFAEASAGRPGTQPWSHPLGPAGGALARRGRAMSEQLLAAWTAAAAKRAWQTAYAEQLQMLELVMELWERVPDAAAHVGCRSCLCGRGGGRCRVAGWGA